MVLMLTVFFTFKAVADEAVSMPLGFGTTQITPKTPKYPRLVRGTSQVDFYLNGSQLPNMLSRNLSTACARGNFNQLVNKKYYVMVDMPGGTKKKLGFADYTGINLSDPDNRKGPNQAYFFDKDRTSECKVYAAVTQW